VTLQSFFLITGWAVLLSARNDPSRIFWTLAPCLVFPIVIPLFLMYRGDAAFKLYMEVERADRCVMDHISDMTKNFTLINDYSKKGKFADAFVEKMKKLIKSIVARSAVNTNTRFFPEVVSRFLISGWIILAGPSVGTPAMTMGMFLTNLDIWKKLGDIWCQIFRIYMEFEDAHALLVSISHCVNMSDDTLVRKRVSEKLQEEEHRLMREAAACHKDFARFFAIDDLDICFKSFSHKYLNETDVVKELGPLNFSLQQGYFYAIIGLPGVGKTTLLKYLGGARLSMGKSCGGTLFVPPHLRVLHVAQTPLFFQGTLMENMLFGVHPGDEDGSVERVQLIFQKLGISDSISQMLLTNKQFCPEEVGQTEAVLLHLARAFITNPDIMCVHKPVLTMDSRMGSRLLCAFEEFVRQRGLAKEPKNLPRRRKRTCIITMNRADLARIPDKVLFIDYATLTVKHVEDDDREAQVRSLLAQNFSLRMSNPT